MRSLDCIRTIQSGKHCFRSWCLQHIGNSDASSLATGGMLPGIPAAVVWRDASNAASPASAHSACLELREAVQLWWDVAVALAETADLAAEHQKAREHQLLAALAQWVSDPSAYNCNSAELVSLRPAGAGRYMGGGLLSVLFQQHPTAEASSTACQTGNNIVSDRLSDSSPGWLPSNGATGSASIAAEDATPHPAPAANVSATSDVQADAQPALNDMMAADAITGGDDDDVGMFGFRLPPPTLANDTRSVFEFTLLLESFLSRLSDHCKANGIAFDMRTGLAAYLAGLLSALHAVSLSCRLRTERLLKVLSKVCKSHQ